MRRTTWESGVLTTLGRDVSIGPHGMSVLVPCQDECGQTHTIELRGSIPPQGIRRNMEKDGWNLASRKRACPSCNAAKAHRKEPEPMPKDTQPVIGATVAPPAPPAPSIESITPSEAARAQRRQVMTWLEESYDVPNKRYTAGVTDATIAKETGAAVAAVAKLREEFYGPLVEPDELVALRVEIEGVRNAMRQVREGFDTKQSALQGRLTVVTDKMEKLAREQGWKL